MISVPSSGGFAINASVSSPVNLNSGASSGGLNPTASAAPLSANSEPEPICCGVKRSFASPRTEIVPNGCSAKVRISGEVVPESFASPDPISVAGVKDSARVPVKENSSCLSSGFAVKDSAAPDSANREPEPMWFGTRTVTAAPEILMLTSGCSANVSSSEEPLKLNRTPSPICVAGVKDSPRTPVNLKRTCSSGGFAMKDSSAPPLMSMKPPAGGRAALA